MKYLFEKVKLTAVLISLPLVLTSCPEPEPDFVDPVTKNAQLSSIEIEENTDNNQYSESILFRYDENDRIKEIRWGRGSSSGYTTEFSWNPFSMLWNGKKVNITLSPAGYITYAKAWVATEYNTYEYDTAGRLIRETCNDDDYYEEITYVWREGLLVEVESHWSEGSYSGKRLGIVSYGTEKNVTGIWPASFWESELLWFEPDDYDSPYILQAGLLGVAPYLLPVSITEENISGSGSDVSRWSSKYLITPHLDSKGRLSIEEIEENYRGSKEYYRLKYNYK